MGRGSATDENGIHPPGPAHPGQLTAQRPQVKVDQVVLPGGDREIAIPAVLGTERDVDVRGSGPKPGWGIRAEQHIAILWARDSGLRGAQEKQAQPRVSWGGPSQ